MDHRYAPLVPDALPLRPASAPTHPACIVAACTSETLTLHLADGQVVAGHLDAATDVVASSPSGAGPADHDQQHRLLPGVRVLDAHLELRRGLPVWTRVELVR